MPVLRIKSTHKESQGEFVLIDEKNFDPKKHELYVEAPPEPVKDPNSDKETGSDADKEPVKDPNSANKATKKSENK